MCADFVSTFSSKVQFLSSKTLANEVARLVAAHASVPVNEVGGARMDVSGSGAGANGSGGGGDAAAAGLEADERQEKEEEEDEENQQQGEMQDESDQEDGGDYVNEYGDDDEDGGGDAFGDDGGQQQQPHIVHAARPSPCFANLACGFPCVLALIHLLSVVWPLLCVPRADEGETM
jgi:hypothetical protein